MTYYMDAIIFIVILTLLSMLAGCMTIILELTKPKIPKKRDKGKSL